ncbi:MBL fold metallo-hydrolase [Portibacter marinus]|uniref:MBL fold metallo-hydrolase n=1 Tax=Portibacter marinus TaxID=2898660 RepID=UPI001F3E616E|nr:MBL fold metallo-hydrolase [Portibacter marinus]
MQIKRIYDEGLAHASYAIISQDKMMVVDPARDPKPYFDLAKEQNVDIVGVIETHPHADFVSSHLEIHEATNAVIYASKNTLAAYPHEPFSNGAIIELGKIKLKALDTPGHSPDSISVLVFDENGNQQAVFSGDTLFIGDVGRPDLRENAAHLRNKRKRFAKQMYHSTRDVLMKLNPDIMVYPAHGPGSLCGKGMSDELSSTLDQQLRENPALQTMTEDEFVDYILEGQPFIPKYFKYDVEVNKLGAANLNESIQKVEYLQSPQSLLLTNGLIIDVRSASDFRSGHYPGAVNIMNGAKFETWLGSIVDPKERFYLIAKSKQELSEVLGKSAKIGYESHIIGALEFEGRDDLKQMPELNLNELVKKPKNFTIVDIRNKSEFENGKFFDHSVNIPLHELRERAQELPSDRPIIVHCASGYRSAAGASIVFAALGEIVEVMDLSDHIKQFQ